MKSNQSMRPKPGLLRLSTRWRLLVRLASAGIDHHEVNERVAQGAALSGGYLLMTATSAAIAILGLLLASPAVVIGAMLLSPLMGPIVRLGFSFWTVDWRGTRQALAGLVVGFGLALLVSIALTIASPLKEPTAEILARSRPTLFDLLVAIFSGVAGAYAVVRGKGEAVIGVAIATALMPPLAVVGFGIGTDQWRIAGGALLLFFTNLVAIALAAAVVAGLSGFRPAARPTGTGWLRHVAVLAIVAALCVPLTVSLRTIALESRATIDARRAIAKLFGAKARIASLRVQSGTGGVTIDGLVATPAYVDHASDRLAGGLRSRLQVPVSASLDQVVLADPSRLAETAAPSPPSPEASPSALARGALEAAVPFRDTKVSYDERSGSGVVMLGPASGLDLGAARALEQALQARLDSRGTVVIPAAQPLPPIAVVTGSHAPATLGATDLQRWALRRWNAASVSARFCRGGAKPVRQAEVSTLLTAAFAPLPVTLTVASAQDCRPGSSTAPFVQVSPGSAAPTPQSAGGAAIASKTQGGPTDRGPVRPARAPGRPAG
jgi:uncharacterized hydrophobic protein (TIGR00271 family)